MISSSRMAVIGAQTKDGAYGLGNGMPWPRGMVRQDMARFKHRTTSAPTGRKNLLIVGRETFEAMGSEPLPGRYMVVISRKYEGIGTIGEDVFCSHSIESFLACKADKMNDLHNVFFIGGEHVWQKGFKLSSQAYITVVNKNIDDCTGLKRLSVPLVEQALMAGFSWRNTNTTTDNWNGPVQVTFLEYYKPIHSLTHIENR